MNTVASDQQAMQTISGQEPAMDAVAGSSTAMDAVAWSLMARSKVLGSSYAVNTLWSSSTGSKAVWQDFGSITGSDGNDIRGWEGSFDLSGVSTLKVDTKLGDYTVNVYVGGSQVFSTNSQHGWTARSFDVSGYSGQNTVRLEWDGYKIYDDLVSSGTGSGRALEFYRSGYRDQYYAVFRNLVFE
ncbi:MAG: hypothetical protein ABEK16_03230 [Candidatus Nanohalobium sp.]